MKTLKEKILEAENRTKFWARGINIKFPEALDLKVLEVFGSIKGFRGIDPTNKPRKSVKK